MNSSIRFLTEKYSDKEFHNPYTDWSEILKRIENKFIIRTDTTQPFCNWIGNLKHKQIIKTIPFAAVDELLNKLPSGNSYWIVVDIYGNPNEKHEVYGCNIEALLSVISLYTTGLQTSKTTAINYVGACFFILDNKCNWMTIFEVDRDKKEVMVFKSGNSITPFD